MSDEKQIEVILTGSEQNVDVKSAKLTEQIEKSGNKTKSKNYIMDLRIHSPASLGYLNIEGIDSAPAMVRLAKVKGLDVIAVTDFYSGEFIDRVVQAAKNSSLIVIPGVGIRCRLGSCNDVILSCLFPEEFTSGRIHEFLDALKVPSSARGDRRHLVELPFERILDMVDQAGGVALPSRMDKTPQRLTVVPTLVERFGFRTFDLAYAESLSYFKSRWPKTKFNLYSFSNANALAQVGSRIARVKMSTPGFAGIKEIVARQNLVK